MKLAVSFGGAGVKDGQYNYLNFFVELLDKLVTVILRLFNAIKGENKEEVTTA